MNKAFAERSKNRKRRTFLYLAVLIALLIMLVTATYTWFAISRTPKVYDLAMYINSDSGLELSRGYFSDGEWGQRIDFEDLVSEEFPLRPVTWSQPDGKFLTVRYGFDGRTVGDFIELNDAVNANRSGSEGYYVRGVFYARTNTPCSISLAEAVEVNEGENGSGTFVIGKPVWDGDKLSHYDGGHGAENAVRLGFRVTPVDKNTGVSTGEPQFFVYEPSCDVHTSGETGYVPTPGINGAETIVDPAHLILQGASSWREADPVEHGVTIKTLGKFYENKTLYSFESGEVVRIELYVWLEGQDVDCISRIDEAKILASIQFHVDYSGQSGMDDVPDDD